MSDLTSTCQGRTGMTGYQGEGLCGKKPLYVVTESGRSAQPKGVCGLHLAQVVKRKLSDLNTVTVRKVLEDKK